ncbi:hypothetical protein [Butyrivibrio sp. INlla14]|uniref:hypothetical protein n=1 Tax=Butyrivibrio sp. INlla14 TaxID=1520808 RepID=UPI000876B249|nr:hypothetical protein [Butyrivibrio sp. INlla14]SCY68388.1 hypothetical protein SAMN02910371_03366 [Butyrivibrio sp. INlla14]
MIFSAMMNPEIILLQRKIADYPERIDKMQKRYALVRAPKANNIESAIKGLNAYILQLKVNSGSFDKISEFINADLKRLEELMQEAWNGEDDSKESLQLSHVQLQHAAATVETYCRSIDAQLDGAQVALDKLKLAQKQKKTFDVVNLLAMIEKGDGYTL